tara:strand:- start:5654 stop:6388 length:735 start_codon:yes stop_codon:yes gene_type:complete
MKTSRGTSSDHDAHRRDNSDNGDERGFAAEADNANPNQVFAQKTWLRSTTIAGTPAERYLRSRGLDPDICGLNLRFARLKAEGAFHPCMVARVQGADGSLQAVMRTFLAPTGNTKAEIAHPRMALGRLAGGAVRLREAQDQLILCEGIEDGLALTMALGEPVWAVLGAANFRHVVLPDFVRHIIIAKDNDAVGERAAQAAATTFAYQGFDVSFIAPPAPCKDFNEALQSPGSPVPEDRSQGELA